MLSDFRPQFVMIDEFGENPISETTIQKRKLKRLPWFSIFGTAYCDVYGKEFFLNAPAWKAEDLGPHGVAVIANESFVEWLRHANAELIGYFESEFPCIKSFREKFES